jgi:hypothetical protein
MSVPRRTERSRIMQEGSVQCVHRGKPGEGLPLVPSAYGHTILMGYTPLV